MRIGIDFHLAEREGTGNCTYMRNLIESLVRLDTRDEYILYVTDSTLPYYRIFDQYQHVHLRSLGVKSPLLRMPLLGFQTFIDKIDILHANYYGPPFFRGALILTIHDLSFLSIPECFTVFETTKNKLLIPGNVRKAAVILTVSEFSKRDIVKTYNISQDIVEVGYNGANKIFRPLTDKKAASRIIEGYGISERYILYVGRLNKRKNLTGLVQAFTSLKEKAHIPHQLVIGGIKDFLPAEEAENINNSPYKDDIIFTGYLPEEHLPVFYGLAEVFVYPSFYEGFGLPCLEAMCCGCPVISSNATSLPEVVGEAGILIDPFNVEALSKAILEVVSSEELRAEMRLKGLEQAKKFSWDKAAQKMIDVINVIRG